MSAGSVIGVCASLCLMAVGAATAGEDLLLQAVDRQYGYRARRKVEAWYKLMAGINAQVELGDEEKARVANDFFNQLSWVSDLDHWGQDDYWATPVEMLATNGGDCEDFSIAKYFTLSEVGVALEKLRITYVKTLEYNRAHMVLAYYPSPEAEPWILDNINKTLLPASQRPDLIPIYSFNGLGLWLAKDRNRRISDNTQQSLPQWAEVNRRLSGEMQRRRP